MTFHKITWCVIIPQINNQTQIYWKCYVIGKKKNKNAKA